MLFRSMLPELLPRQLGVGVRGGAEAIVHAARAFVSSTWPCHALVKLDLVNAFNSVRRDSIFEVVANKIPEILPYVISSYETSSSLYHGSFTLQSSEGVQQGDPLGPLLFSLAISATLHGSHCTCTKLQDNRSGCKSSSSMEFLPIYVQGAPSPS